MILDWWLSPELQVGTQRCGLGVVADIVVEETGSFVPGMASRPITQEKGTRGCTDIRHGLQGGEYRPWIHRYLELMTF